MPQAIHFVGAVYTPVLLDPPPPLRTFILYCFLHIFTGTLIPPKTFFAANFHEVIVKVGIHELVLYFAR